jgi:enoyl-CoA hydratase/carnithine racemase
MTTRPVLLQPRDLALGTDTAQLSADGVPVRPLAGVDLTDTATLSDPDAVARAAAAAARSTAVLIGVANAPPPEGAAPLLEALTCTLAAQPAADAAVSARTCVEVADPAATLTELTELARVRPYASMTLSGLLRLTDRVAAQDGLVAESLAYSMLLAGPEFAAWRSARPRRPVPEPNSAAVLVERADDVLTITLNRPERHNAYGRAVRDELVEALRLAELDSSVVAVRLRGAGPSFCSGGDLDEFGTSPDVAAGHVIRLARSAASVLNSIRDRVHAELHGACIGAGIELPSFASTVVAHRDTFFQLPELGMGLVPGAGGTVSVTRRIGRWRTAYLALSGIKLDVDTALQWGLVDGRAEERPPPTASRP